MAKPIKLVEASDDYQGVAPNVFSVVGDLPGGGGERGPEGPQGEQGEQGPAGDDGFGTESQYDDIISRLEALENAG